MNRYEIASGRPKEDADIYVLEIFHYYSHIPAYLMRLEKKNNTYEAIYDQGPIMIGQYKIYKANKVIYTQTLKEGFNLRTGDVFSIRLAKDDYQAEFTISRNSFGQVF